MTSHSNDPHVHSWCELRDPRSSGDRTCCIFSHEWAWKHFVIDSGHVSLRCEPFADWLGEQLAERLASAWSGDCSRDERHELIRLAGDRMAKAVSHCMNAPIVLLYGSLRPSGGQGVRSWRLILPNGCRMIAREIPSGGVLVTCLFPHDVTLALLPAFAWQNELRACVELYGDVNTQTGRPGLPKPARPVVRRSGKKHVTEFDIHFVEPLNWGFSNDSIGASWAMPIEYPPVKRLDSSSERGR